MDKKTFSKTFAFELGKWMTDVAKYMATALIISSVFVDLKNDDWMMVCVIISTLLVLFVGLGFMSANNDKISNNTKK